jgi:hypothetical protein
VKHPAVGGSHRRSHRVHAVRAIGVRVDDLPSVLDQLMVLVGQVPHGRQHGATLSLEPEIKG